MHATRIASFAAALALAVALFGSRAHAQPEVLPGQQVSQVRLSEVPLVSIDDLVAERAGLESELGAARLVGTIFGVVAGLGAAPMAIVVSAGLVLGTVGLTLGLAAGGPLGVLIGLAAFGLPFELLALPVLGPIILGGLVVAAVAGGAAFGAFNSAQALQTRLRMVSSPPPSPFADAASLATVGRF